MRYELLECHGFESAIKATMLSFGKTSFDSFEATIDDMKRLSNKLAPMDGGHNKFLEQIQYWILIQAPCSGGKKQTLTGTLQNLQNPQCTNLGRTV